MNRMVATSGLAVIAALALLAPGPAAAWWRPHYFYGPALVFGPPVVVAPPVYVGPPVIYAPAPYPPPAAQTCYAGAYICPLDQPAPVGGGCSCPTNSGRAYGQAR